MLKKRLSIVMFAAIFVFAAFGMAQAVQVDGMRSGFGSAATAPLPVSLDVHVNPGGLGDALIYGYYNVRSGYNIIRVVNTSTSLGVSAKVRFREGRNSQEILDFYICLSAGDQWTALLYGDATTSTPAGLVWWDNDTPTYPDPQSNDDATDNMNAVIALRYSATGADASISADDTKEGYFEIIGNRAWTDTMGSAKVVQTPRDCGWAALQSSEQPTLTSADNLYGSTSFTSTITDVPNSLLGNVTIIPVDSSNIIQGTYAYNATALADFQSIALAGSLGVDSIPTLSDSQDLLVGVNYALTKAVEYATYDIAGSLTANTTIINTFPTKRRSIIDSGSCGSAGSTSIGGSINGPFNNSAYTENSNCTGVISTTTYRCEQVLINVYDDKENVLSNPTGFSPSQTTTLEKCDEVSLIVVGTGRTALVNSALVQFNLDTSTYTLGWISEDFTGTGRTTVLNSITTEGLPVISYELQNYIGTGTSEMRPLRYSTVITSAL